MNPLHDREPGFAGEKHFIIMKKSKEMNRTEKDLLKRAKLAARNDFGFETVKVSRNHKKYSRSAEKRVFRNFLDE